MLKRLRSTSVLLALGYVGLFAFSTLLLIGLLWWRTAGHLEQETDAAVTTDTNQIRDQLREFGLVAARDAIQVRVAENPNRRGLYLLADGNFKPVAGNLEAWPIQVGRKQGWYRVELDRGGQPQWIRFRATELSGGMHLLVGRDIGDHAEIRALIIDALSWAGVTSLLLAVGGGVLMRRSVLHRVEMINATAAAIIQGDLSRRVPTRGTADEFDQLALTINRMLQQIQQLIEGIRNTANAVAHDLRTPLTELRARLEEFLRRPPATVSSFEEIQKAVSDIDRVIRVFNALLRLAEIDSGVRRSGFHRFDLGEITMEVAELYGPLIETKDAAFVVNVPDGLAINGDPYLLAQAIGNLVDNAVKYTPRNGTISLCVDKRSDGTIKVVVADSGPGIPDSEKPRATERFYRYRANGEAEGIGLGLSVVEAVARLHDGELRLADNNPGLLATLSLPVAGPNPAAILETQPA